MSAFSGGFWFEQSEEERRKYSFVIDDPTIWPDVVEELSEGVKLVAIVHRYEYRSKKLKCIHCNKTLHFFGAIVLLSNGRFARIGSTCGPHLFPDQWRDAVSAFDQAMRTAETQRRLDELTERVPIALETLRRLRLAFKESEHILGSIIGVIGSKEFLYLRSQALRHNGALMIERVIRRDIAELFREAQGKKSADDDETKIEESYQTELFHRVRGHEFLSLINPEKAINATIDALENCQRQLADANYVKRKKALTLCNEVKEGILLLGKSYSAMFRFFDADNLAKIEAWFSNKKRIDWCANGTALTLLDEGRVIKRADLNGKNVLPELAVSQALAGITL